MQEIVPALVGILALIFSLYLIYFVFAVVSNMARARGHSPWPWWFISLAWSPFGAMVVLWMFFDIQDRETKMRHRRGEAGTDG